MGKNQHVTPHKRVVGKLRARITQEQQLEQIRRLKLYREHERLHEIKNQNCLFMEEMGKLEKETHMEMIHFRREDKL